MQMRYLSDVVTLSLDRQKCNGCGVCAVVCPHHVFDIEDRRSAIVDRDACMECGACARNCVPAAVSVQAGVGCAAAVLNGMLRGGEPTCECAAEPACCD